MIITLLNLKGGCGKTTLSIHIASTLALAGKKVLVIDADEQMSAVNWSNSREEEPIFTVAGIPSNTLHKQVKRMEKDYDFIIIDGPPRVSNVSKSCVVASDLVLIPVTPSPYDVWASAEVVDIFNDVKILTAGHKKINAAIIINRKIKNTKIGDEAEKAMEDFNLPILKTVIHQRINYADSAARGMSAVEEDPDSLAGKEIRELVSEILEFSGLIQNKEAA